MIQRRKKILFMAEGITMTHFVRPAALAESLDPGEFDVYFRTPRRYHRLLQRPVGRIGELRTIEPEAFLAALAQGAPPYTADDLMRYVEDDLRTFDEVRPDLVIGDFRLSLCVSAPLAGIPFASIFNAQWSPFARQPAVVPEIPLTRYVSPCILNRLFAAIRPAVFALHSKPVNDARRHFGLPRLSHDLRAIYTAGDFTLYPDIPEFAPVSTLPSSHHYIGACPWSVDTFNTARPAWWNDVMHSPRQKIFISLGSSGPVKALPAVLRAAASLPVEIILATSGRDLGPLASNIHTAALLPYVETASKCAFVVSHGGTGGLYPALTAGAPMLAVPSNIDNHLSTALLTKSGAGLSIRVESATPERLRTAMERLLYDGAFKSAAQNWAEKIARYDTHTIFPAILKDWFASKSQGTVPVADVRPASEEAECVGASRENSEMQTSIVR